MLAGWLLCLRARLYVLAFGPRLRILSGSRVFGLATTSLLLLCFILVPRVFHRHLKATDGKRLRAAFSERQSVTCSSGCLVSSSSPLCALPLALTPHQGGGKKQQTRNPRRPFTVMAFVISSVSAGVKCVLLAPVCARECEELFWGDDRVRGDVLRK